ncbi:hypothetical protein B0H34DRAFT_722303 [Crassisporium funariophilum]|nr:hypothetical protein B0H34DRAFT_722303 [Crassisporium funariophilum]
MMMDSVVPCRVKNWLMGVLLRVYHLELCMVFKIQVACRPGLSCCCLRTALRLCHRRFVPGAWDLGVSLVST